MRRRTLCHALKLDALGARELGDPVARAARDLDLYEIVLRSWGRSLLSLRDAHYSDTGR